MTPGRCLGWREMVPRPMRCQVPNMPEFCDVAVPVPLDAVFTYRIPDGSSPVVGGRVLVPFRQQRVSGVVTELHSRTPGVQTKNVIAVIDTTPVLDDQLIRLGKWISNYY